MLERDRDPFLPLPSRPTRPRSVTTPFRQPVCQPPLPLPHPRHVSYLLAHHVFSPGGGVFFCDTDNLSGSLKVRVFFPRMPRLADSPTRLLHQQTVC